MSHKVNFEALVRTTEDKDTVLAEALGVIDQHCPVEKFQANRFTPDVVGVLVQFWVANDNEAAAKTREVAKALSRRWPTDTIRLNGRPITQEV